MKRPESCLIVGAGIAGLMAAHNLQTHGVKITVLDKGRGVGGRVATRWVENEAGEKGFFDHGAQFFTVRDLRFQKFVDEWLALGLVKEWTRGFANADHAAADDGHPRYCGTAGMNSIARHLANGLNVQVNAKVEHICRDDQRWRLQLESGQEFTGDALILTPPVPQSLSLLGKEADRLPIAMRRALANISYDPCFAVLAVLAEPSRLPVPGALQLIQEPIAWIADNYRKGISPDVHTVTIHAGPEFTRQHWDADPNNVAQILLDAAQGWLGALVKSWQVHRWRYSQPQHSYPESCLLVNDTPPLLFAGDAFGAPRMEGAALSGLAAAKALLQLARPAQSET